MHRLPPILQFSYVVEDLDAAINHWAEVLQVGPFFVLEHVPYETCYYRGAPSDVDMSVALAYSGDVQIELVKQHNNADSIFKEFLASRGPGLQHVGALTEDLESDLRGLKTIGIEPVQWGTAENGTRFVYVDSDMIAGCMLELFQIPEELHQAFAYMKKKAANWQPGQDSARH